MDNYKKEIWKDIVGYEDLYQVSSFGRILSFPRNTSRGGIMSFYLAKDGLNYSRPTLRLTKNGVGKLHHICRLVALAFLPNQENKPEVNHLDCNPQNNRVENLEWTTRKENHIYSVGLNRMASCENHGRAKLNNSQVLEIRASNLSTKDLAKKYNVSTTTITRILKRSHWKTI